MEQSSAAQCVLYRADDITEHFTELEPAVNAWRDCTPADVLLWIDVCRPSVSQMDLLARTFPLHPLSVEDALEGGQRGKFERYDSSNFLVLRPASIVGAHTIELAEIDLFIGEGFLITAHRDGATPLAPGDEAGTTRASWSGANGDAAGGATTTADGSTADGTTGDITPAGGQAAEQIYDPEAIAAERAKRRSGRRGYQWHTIDAFQQIHTAFAQSRARQWLADDTAPNCREEPQPSASEENHGRSRDAAHHRGSTTARSLAAAYALLHRIIDRIVDQYGPVLDDLEDEADDLEAQIFGGEPISSHDIYGLSRGILDLDRVIKPLPTLMQGLASFAADSGLANELMRNLRDVTDHVHGISDRLERLRSILHEIFNVNSTLVAERQGDQTKRISAWAGIFFFPSLVAGVYGMNFENMPELEWFWGYPFALVLMAVGCVIMYAVFKRKDWV